MQEVAFAFPEVNCVALTCKGLESQKECVLSFVCSFILTDISLSKVEKRHFSNSFAQFNLWDLSSGAKMAMLAARQPQPRTRVTC